jgi:hypothetical protein
MSLLEELESRGVTAEDLEKAASVRLFEKTATAQGVDLDSLDVNQVEELYTVFVSNQSHDDHHKEASAMNEEIIDLFEKTAAHEGINLDDMHDEELTELYNHYVENVLPEQVAEYDDGEEVEDAHAKLAEAEILGRHMARAYMDECDKEASYGDDEGYELDLDNMSAADLIAIQSDGYEVIFDGGYKTASAYKYAGVSREEKARRKAAVAQAQGMSEEKARKAHRVGGTKGPGPRSANAGSFKSMSEKSRSIGKQQALGEAAKQRVVDAKKKLRGATIERAQKAIGTRAKTLGRAMGVQGGRNAKLLGGATMAAGGLGLAGAGYAGARAFNKRYEKAASYDDRVDLAFQLLADAGYDV